MSSRSVQPIVKISNLSLTYNPGKATEFQALKNINLEIFPEEFVIFFGPSGSGKSTLLYIIAGLESPTTGTVSVAGNADLSKLNEKELIEYHRSCVGMIFQAFYLIPSLTARDNVMLPMIFKGVDPSQRGVPVDKLLDRFGITTFKDRTPTHLSGGQQQRVAIARSLVNDPAIVLADEPVGNLDSKNSAIVLELIKDLHTKDKKTVILVTHDPSHLQHANRVFHIKDGEIIKMDVQTPVASKTTPETADQQLTTPKVDHQSLLQKLAAKYNNLTEAQLKAKLLVNLTLSPYDFETLENTEETIAQYLEGKVKEKDVLEKLDLPATVGGVGLYKQTAAKLLNEVNKLTKEIAWIDKGTQRKNIDENLAKAQQIVEFVLKEYSGSLSKNQTNRFIVAVKSRLAGKFTKDELRAQLDKPFGQAGVGMNRRSAESLSQKIEVVLMQQKL